MPIIPTLDRHRQENPVGLKSVWATYLKILSQRGRGDTHRERRETETDRDRRQTEKETETGVKENTQTLLCQGTLITC